MSAASDVTLPPSSPEPRNCADLPLSVSSTFPPNKLVTVKRWLWLCAGYFALGLLGLALTFPTTNAAPLWPAAGLAVAMLWRHGPGLWSAVAVGGFLATLLGKGTWALLCGGAFTLAEVGVAGAALTGLGNALAALAAAGLLRWLRADPARARVRDVLFLACVAAPLEGLVSATGGVAALALFADLPSSLWAAVGGTWATGDGVGILLVTPAVLVSRGWAQGLGPRKLELGALALSAVAAPLLASLAAGLVGKLGPFAYLCYPPLVWAAMRFPRGIAAGVTLVVSGLVVLLAMLGEGPFDDQAGFLRQLAAVQTFIAVGAVTADVLGALATQRAVVLRELRDSEARFRLVSEGSTDLVCLHDLDGTYRWLSPSVTPLLGWQPAELIGRNPYDLIHPDDVPRIRQRHLARTAERATSDVAEFRLRRKDGSYAWLETASQVVLSPGGERVGLQASSRDIGQRLQALERLRLVAAAIHLGLFDWNIIANRNDWDEQMRDLFGVAPTTPDGTSAVWLERVHPEDREATLEHLRGALAGLHPYDCRFRIQHPTRGERVLAAMGTVERDGSGRAVRLLGINWDITERVGTEKALAGVEAALAQKERQLSLALQASNVGLWDWSVPDGAVAFSDTWLSMLGYAAGELAGHVDSWVALVHPDELPGVMEAVAATLRGESTWYRTQHRCRHKDGHWLWILDSGRVIERSADGAPLRMIGTHVDITPLKEAEVELRAAREAAEQAARVKSEFLAVMSHEIRTPMNGVLGMASLLAGTQLDTEQREIVETIRASGQTLLAILNDILDFSRIDAGKLELERTAFRPLQVTREVLALFIGDAAHRSLALRLDWPQHLAPALVGDPTRMRQVLMNLVSNALKFTERGEVVLSARTLPAAPSAPHGYLELCVRDSGIGLTPEGLARLFQHFSQSDSSTTRRFGGSGLGLAICKRLVEAMGGTIGAQSHPGQGSTFRFTLPLPAPDFRVVEEPTAAPAPAPAITGRVLLVEDNVVNQRVAHSMLMRLGCVVEVAENGLLALAALERFRPDLILMDCQMPTMDGFEATRRLRELEREQDAPRRPVLALTANAFAEDRAACLAAGMDDVLSKPITLELLRTGLQRWLAPRAESDSAPS